MKLLHELTIQNLKLNKKRSLATIIGICLSCALIFTVLTGVSSLRETFKKETIKKNGDWHISTSKEDLFEKVKNNKDYLSSYEVYELGYVDIKDVSDNGDYFSIKAASEEIFNNSKILLTEGRFPKNNKEIILRSNVNKLYNNGLKVDQDISFELNKVNRVNQKNSEINNEFISIGNKSFKIVGIFENADQTFSGYGEFTGITQIDPSDKYIEKTLYYKLSESKNINSHVKQIYTDKEDYIKNNNLLKTEGVGFSDQAFNMIYAFAGIISLLIFFTSVSVIRNSFSISIVEKTKQYGILKSLGATDKQIKNDILFESFFLGGIGIISGLILGIVSSRVMILLINYIGKDLIQDATIIYKFSPLGVLLSILITLLTILFASLRLAWRAKKFTAISAIKGSNDIKINPKELRTPGYIDNIFGFAGLVSYKNLKRNKRKYRTTVLSLITSVVLMISAFYLTDMMKESIDMTSQDISTNINLFSVATTENRDHFRDLEKIAKDNLKDEEFVISEKYSTIINKKDLNENSDTADIANEYMDLVFIDDNTFDKALKDNGLDSSTKYITSNFYKVKVDEKTHLIEALKNFDIKVDFINDIQDENTGESKEIFLASYDMKIAKIDKPPFGYHKLPNDNLQVFARKSQFEPVKDMEVLQATLMIDSSNDLELEKQMSSYLDENNINNIEIINLSQGLRTSKAFVSLMKFFLYSLIAVLTAIAVTNIFNTINANMQSRKVEFASLKSLGMKESDLIKMNRLESIFLGTRAVIYGTIIGIGFTVLFHMAMREKIDMKYKLPILGIAISIVFVFAIVRLVMAYSSSKMKSINIIETIRNENI